MFRTRDVINSLPLLAAVLGRNYGVKVHIGGSEAKTNGKVIFLPSLPLDCEAELLALARGYIDHEAAHIRHSDFAVLEAAHLDAVTLTIANALEDWRVEERQSETYPGCRQHFDWLTRKYCIEEWQKGVKEAGANPASSILEYVMLTTSAWAVPEVEQNLRPVRDAVDTQFPGLRKQMDAVLDRVHADCPDTAAAIAYAREIAESTRRWQPPASPRSQEDQQAQPKQEDAEKQDTISTQSLPDGQDEGDTPEMGSGDSPDEPKAQECRAEKRDNGYPSQTNPKMPEPDAADTSMKLEENEQTKSCEQSQEAADLEPRIAALFAADGESLPKTKGELTADTLTANHAPTEYTGLTVALEGQAYPGMVSSTEKEEALRASTALRSRLQGLLQAQTRQHIGIGRRGSLEPANLFRLQIGNPRVFRKEEEHTGLNTAVHILLDASYSMRGEAIRLARQACYAVAKALHGVRDVNPAVTAFPALRPDDSVCPLMRHGTALPGYRNMEADGRTPLAPALWWAMQTMLPLRESRKLILVVTDGEPDSVAATDVALEAAHKAGFEVYGIGIRNVCIARLLPNSSRVIWKLPELAPAMFGMLQQALLRGREL